MTTRPERERERRARTRKDLATSRTLSWACEAYERGEHDEALAWLHTLDATGYELSGADRHVLEELRRKLGSVDADGPAGGESTSSALRRAPG